MTSLQSTAWSLFGKYRRVTATATLRTLVIIGALMLPAACVYVPFPDVGHKSGRAVITEGDMEYLKAGEGSITRKQVLLMLGVPNERYNRDEYFCYDWERLIGFWFIAGAAPYGPPFIAGDTIGKAHLLCMQFDPDSRLVHIEHIEEGLLGDVEEDRKVIMRRWSKSASGDRLKVTTYGYYDLDRIKHEVIHALAVEGYPEAQWRLYDEFGRKPEDLVWLCRSADGGYAKAQLEVGRVYWDDTSIPKHKIKAFVWYRLATAGDKPEGSRADRETLIQADSSIRDAVNALNQKQLIEAYDIRLGQAHGHCEQELSDAVSR